MEFIPLLKWAVVVLGGYFLGNISTGILISRLVAKDDVRKYGSGSTGTTNMFRFMGMKASVLTLIGDMLKAAIASFLGILLLGKIGGLVGGAVCVVGHNWPVLYGFRGGKGIAATAGAMFVNQPLLALILVPLAIVSIRLVGIVSVVSLVGITVYTLITAIVWWGNWPYLVFAIALWGMAIFSHRANIKRIFNGTEKNNRLQF